jgi:hypothetical protein
VVCDPGRVTSIEADRRAPVTLDWVTVEVLTIGGAQ